MGILPVQMLSGQLLKEAGMENSSSFPDWAAGDRGRPGQLMKACELAAIWEEGGGNVRHHRYHTEILV